MVHVPEKASVKVLPKLSKPVLAILVIGIAIALAIFLVPITPPSTSESGNTIEGTERETFVESIFGPVLKRFQGSGDISAQANSETGNTTTGLCGNGVCDVNETCGVCPSDCLNANEVCCDNLAIEGNCCSNENCNEGSECQQHQCIEITPSPGSNGGNNGSGGGNGTGGNEVQVQGPICGNGVIEESEECDGLGLAGSTCTSFNFEAGVLRCSSECKWDTTACVLPTDNGGNNLPVCGNNIINGTEECDGTSLNAHTCTTKGFTTGTLSCNVDCKFNTAQCTNPPSPVCGNNTKETGEECDGTDLASQTCVLKGFTGGTLGCTAGCKVNTSNCTGTPSGPICGNNIKETGENCDGTDLASQTCITKGFLAGTLSCTVACNFDTTNCNNVVPETNCSNGLDDDGDGKTDCFDPDCAGKTYTCMDGPWAVSKGEWYCQDGIDNDGDGEIDCHDDYCTSMRSELCTSSSCSDTDGGAYNYKTKGTCTDQYSARQDTCESGKLKEWRCNATTNLCISSIENCSCNGTSGVCSNSCTDPDGGKFYFKGSKAVDVVGHQGGDHCESSTQLREYSCDDTTGGLTSTYVTCPGSCEGTGSLGTGHCLPNNNKVTIFVTNYTFTSFMGGFWGAAELCMGEAMAGGGPQFYDPTSSTAQSVVAFIEGEGTGMRAKDWLVEAAYYNTQNQLIASSKSALLNASYETPLANAIRYKANGQEPSTSNYKVWTGDITHDEYYTGNNCSYWDLDYTGYSTTGYAGEWNEVSGRALWTHYACNNQAHLYCLLYK